MVGICPDVVLACVCGCADDVVATDTGTGGKNDCCAVCADFDILCVANKTYYVHLKVQVIIQLLHMILLFVDGLPLCVN